MSPKARIPKTPEPKTGGRQLVGIIVSLKTPNTAIIAVTHTYRHPLYKKILRKTRRMAVHFEGQELNVKDLVRVRETRPISKTKHFVIVGKVETV